MDVENILKFIGLISVIQQPEKFQNLLDLVLNKRGEGVEHGYYSLKTGNKYIGEIYIHGCGSPFTDGHGNVIVWR